MRLTVQIITLKYSRTLLNNLTKTKLNCKLRSNKKFKTRWLQVKEDLKTRWSTLWKMLWLQGTEPPSKEYNPSQFWLKHKCERTSKKQRNCSWSSLTQALKRKFQRRLIQLKKERYSKGTLSKKLRKRMMKMILSQNRRGSKIIKLLKSKHLQFNRQIKKRTRNLILQLKAKTNKMSFQFI